MSEDVLAVPTDLNGLRKRALRAALIWAMVAVTATAAFTCVRLNNFYRDAHARGQQRLEILRDNVEAHFHTIAGLSHALAAQPDMAQFLLHTSVPAIAGTQAQQRLRLQSELLSRDTVQRMSTRLEELAHWFHLRQAYIQNTEGTSVADSDLSPEASTLGANFAQREYFQQAMSEGLGFQFVMGRISQKPGFNFSARISDNGHPLGVLILKTDPTAMQRLFQDTVGRVISIVDRNGVVVAGNRPSDLLQSVPDARPSNLTASEILAVYLKTPQPLPWQKISVGLVGDAWPGTVIDGKRHLAQSLALEGYPYRLWVWTPLAQEADMIDSGVIAALALTGLGWAVLWAWWRRNERRHAVEHARHEALEMTRALPLGLFRWRVSPDGSGHFSHVGPGVERIFGDAWPALQANPQDLWRLASPDASGPPPHAVEFEWRHGGQSRWLSVNSAVAQTADGNAVHDGYWLDVTARKRAESRFDLAFEHAPTPFLFVHRHKGIVRANPAAVALFGDQGGRGILGLKPWQPPLSDPHPEGKAAVEAQVQTMMDRCREGRNAMRFDWRHTRVLGTGALEPFDVEVRLISLAEEDPDLYFFMIEDVTQRRQTASALQAATEAAEANTRAKSAFLANMSHEIRTPMNAIIGMTHLALEEHPPERVRGYVAKAHQAASSLLQILNDVLDLSKIEAGRLVLESVDFPLQQLLDQVNDVLGLPADRKGLELLFSAPPDLPSHLQGDPTRLRQVFVNLGSNAVKFSESGSVTLGLEMQSQSGQDVVLHGWVKDSGPGLAKDDIERLFRPFTQLDASTTRRHGGTGLGLTISRQLVEHMGGRMWVESEPGHGATFHFTARLQLPAQPRPMAPKREDWRGKRLLIVDDHSDAREVLAAMATGLGLQADVAADANEALRLLDAATAPYDWLLLDWLMPGVDGVKLARQILARPSEQQPCILLVTAFNQQEAMAAASDVALAGILTKPVSPSTLFDALSRSAVVTLAEPDAGIAPPTAPSSLGAIGPATSTTARPMPPARPTPLAGTRILLVEDQPLNQELALELLERAGATVTLADDGQIALDTLAATATPFDCVLMDCQMPRMDGYTATAHIRRNPRWQHLPIIAMTASALVTDREQALLAGMNDHVPKPLDVQQMFTVIERWVKAGRQAAARGAPH
ncbi:MAG: response regulator [Aquabacterium sp.]|uniref:response regulator n=1 Tax=Aquabacterium sp. TaxID=1872578 RepID=UPI001DED106A|nr:response regulator [Aquabacterium sp.]MBT9611593.1 response regulator [Aquabacterium sp.]